MIDVVQYRSLQPDLGNYWPSLTTRWTNKFFWDHEWTVHGNCSCDVLPPLQYFFAAITQSKKTNIRQWLRIATPRPIQPLDSGLFKQSAIENAIKAVIGNNLNIYVSCKRYSDSRYYLYEIYICLDKTTTNYVTCPASSSLRGCPEKKDDPLIKYITISGTSVHEESPNELIQSFKGFDLFMLSREVLGWSFEESLLSGRLASGIISQKIDGFLAVLNITGGNFLPHPQKLPFAVLSNPEKTHFHIFFCNYDLTDMHATSKTFLRQKVTLVADSFAHKDPHMKNEETPSSISNIDHYLQQSSGCNDLNVEDDKEEKVVLTLFGAFC
ncbi:hypothetical protein LguiB_013488 [Lonicera macranthoides]